MFMTDPEAVTAKLQRLSNAGLRISLDDFGTGFSSLNLLRQLPLDAVKIDKAFIDEMTGSEQDTLLVRKIIEIAAGMGIETIAEGIETAEQLDLLASIGCTYAQGYYICKPMEPDAALQSAIKATPPRKALSYL